MHSDDDGNRARQHRAALRRRRTRLTHRQGDEVLRHIGGEGTGRRPQNGAQTQQLEYVVVEKPWWQWRRSRGGGGITVMLFLWFSTSTGPCEILMHMVGKKQRSTGWWQHAQRRAHYDFIFLFFYVVDVGRVLHMVNQLPLLSRCLYFLTSPLVAPV